MIRGASGYSAAAEARRGGAHTQESCSRSGERKGAAVRFDPVPRNPRLSRRGFISGLLAAPAVITTPGLLMPVRAWPQSVVTLDMSDFTITLPETPDFIFVHRDAYRKIQTIYDAPGVLAE